MINDVLKRLLELDLKETEILDNYSYDLYRTLVIELTKIKCNLSPGYTMSCKKIIRKIITDYKLNHFLVSKKVIDDIEKIINE